MDFAARLEPPPALLPSAPLWALAPLLLCYGAGLWLAFRVYRDYPRGNAMSFSWLLIAASMAMGAIRYAFEIAAFAAGPEHVGAAIGFRQAPNVLFNALLLAGVLTMWLAFSRYRMGVRFRWPHVIGFPGILSLAGANAPGNPRRADSQRSRALLSAVVHQSRSSIMRSPCLSNSARPFSTSPPRKCAQRVAGGI